MIHGFVWQGQESLDGQVTDAQDRGVAAEVHVVVGSSDAKAGKKDLAIRNYQKSLELNPKNNNARDQLKKLGR